MKLYLIGNGFDCYLHEMPTQYYNFRSYIVSKFPGCEEYSDLVPSGIMMPKGDIRYDEEEVAGYIVSIIAMEKQNRLLMMVCFLHLTIPIRLKRHTESLQSSSATYMERLAVTWFLDMEMIGR